MNYFKKNLIKTRVFLLHHFFSFLFGHETVKDL